MEPGANGPRNLLISSKGRPITTLGFGALRTKMKNNNGKKSGLKAPRGYQVYQTLMGTWRWSKGVFGTPSWTDGENLATEDDAILDAIRDAALPA